jgi:hypothetical protein
MRRGRDCGAHGGAEKCASIDRRNHKAVRSTVVLYAGVSARIARQCVLVLLLGAIVTSQPPDRAHDVTLAEAISEFSAEREQRDDATAHTVDAAFFDGRVVWPIRSVRVGSPRPASTRAVRALMTLERYLGWPVLQLALAGLESRNAAQTATPSDLLSVTSSIAGRDLSWMQPLFDSKTIYDYGIDRVELHAGGNRYESEVVVKRYGAGVFAGTSKPRADSFESGRGVVLHVEFADGQSIVETWDGRDGERRFRYESAAPVALAIVDPEGVIVVDEVRANNIWSARETSRPAGIDPIAIAWSARWATWLQDRLLLWSALL